MHHFVLGHDHSHPGPQAGHPEKDVIIKTTPTNATFSLRTLHVAGVLKRVHYLITCCYIETITRTHT